MKIRTINTGALIIKQIITKNLVFSYSNNKSLFNGKKGIKLTVKKRSKTNL